MLRYPTLVWHDPFIGSMRPIYKCDVTSSCFLDIPPTHFWVCENVLLKKTYNMFLKILLEIFFRTIAASRGFGSISFISKSAHQQLPSTSTSTKCLRNGAWTSATYYLNHSYKRPMTSSRNWQNLSQSTTRKFVKEYQALIGSFLYLQVHTFPEISWAVSVLSKYMIRPGQTHLVMV